MELNEQEQQILQNYLSVAREPQKIWIILLTLGAIFSVSAVILLCYTSLLLSFSLLLFVIGLVTVAWGCEKHNKMIAAQIMHKYHQTLEEIERQSGRQPGESPPRDEHRDS